MSAPKMRCPKCGSEIHPAHDSQHSYEERRTLMAIDANVAYVSLNENGSGTLHLCDRVPKGSRGQSWLDFATAPYEVTALNGLSIWAGGSGPVMLGDKPIGTREGYTRISFTERELFLEAVAEYHHARRAADQRADGD